MQMLSFNQLPCPDLPLCLQFINLTVVTNPKANASLPCYDKLEESLFKLNIKTQVSKP
jgi:hypothetical protein